MSFKFRVKLLNTVLTWHTLKYFNQKQWVISCAEIYLYDSLYNLETNKYRTLGVRSKLNLNLYVQFRQLWY